MQALSSITHKGMLSVKLMTSLVPRAIKKKIVTYYDLSDKKYLAWL